MKQNVLVTGGAGYIGSHTCKALAACGIQPVAYDNLSVGHRWAVQWGPLVTGDLSDRKLLRQTLLDFEIDSVIHFAAHAYVGVSVKDPRSYFENNFVNSMTLLDAMLETGVNNIVFSSTCATYGAPVQEFIDERHPQVPVNPYGDSKLAVEKMLRWYAEPYRLRWVALRYFNAAGADLDGAIGEAHDPETHLIPLVLAATSTEAPIRIFGVDYPTPDGTCIRDYVHVTDLADAHVQALAYLDTGGANAAFNLGNGKGSSVRTVIETAESITGLPIHVIEAPRRPGDPSHLVANASEALHCLHWMPRFSELSTIIQTAWRWNRKWKADATV